MTQLFVNGLPCSSKRIYSMKKASDMDDGAQSEDDTIKDFNII